MEIKIGMQVHDIYNRQWFEIVKIQENMITLKSDCGFFRSMTRDALERLYNASPINPIKLNK